MNLCGYGCEMQTHAMRVLTAKCGALLMPPRVLRPLPQCSPMFPNVPQCSPMFPNDAVQCRRTMPPYHRSFPFFTPSFASVVFEERARWRPSAEQPGAVQPPGYFQPPTQLEPRIIESVHGHQDQRHASGTPFTLPLLAAVLCYVYIRDTSAWCCLFVECTS